MVVNPVNGHVENPNDVHLYHTTADSQVLQLSSYYVTQVENILALRISCRLFISTDSRIVEVLRKLKYFSSSIYQIKFSSGEANCQNQELNGARKADSKIDTLKYYSPIGLSRACECIHCEKCVI